MTRIVVAAEQAAQLVPVNPVSVGLADVLDFTVARKAKAMRAAMNQIANESADTAVQQSVHTMALHCNDKVFARLFDIAAARIQIAEHRG